MKLSAAEFKRLFAALDLGDDYVAPLLLELEQREYRAGDLLVAHGDWSDTLFFIVGGSVDVSLEAGDRRLELGRIGPGRWCGEFGLIDPAPASATVAAIDDVAVLALDGDALERLHQTAPAAASDLLVRLSLDLAHRLRQTSRHQLVADDSGFVLEAGDDAAEASAGPFARLGRLLGIGGVQ